MTLVTHFNLQAAHPEIQYDLDAELLPRPGFEITRKNSSLSQAAFDRLQVYAEWREMFPASDTNTIGRSLIAATAKGSRWREFGIGKLKAKGIAGIDGRVVTPPLTQQAYDDGMYHFKLTNDLRLVGVLSSPKSMYSLSARGGEREFDCDNQLRERGLNIGSEPIAAGRFFTQYEIATHRGSVPETDLHGTETGAVFIGLPDEFENLARYIQFTTSDSHYSTPPSGHLGQEEITHMKLYENYMAFYEYIAATKRLSCIEGGIFRHASHPGNFTFKGSSATTRIHDKDTCLLEEELGDAPEQTVKGVQLLRDLSSGLLRMIDDFTMQAMSQHYGYYLENAHIMPFYRYLKAFFGEDANPWAVRKAGDFLQQDYISFIRESYQYLQPISASYKEGVDRHSIEQQQAASFQCSVFHITFLQPIITELYLLLRDSKFSRMGFELPEISEDTLKRNIASDVHRYCELVAAYATR